ncbi:hypothetical protein TorRG33x02_027430, partial [Trema orientale]
VLSQCCLSQHYHQSIRSTHLEDMPPMQPELDLTIAFLLFPHLFQEQMKQFDCKSHP